MPVSARGGDSIEGVATEPGEICPICGGADLGTIHLGTFRADDGIVFYAADHGDMAGSSVAAAGDLNADGNGDIPIGSAFGDEAYVIF